MIWELSKTFRFEAAHTLDRTLGGEASCRIHGHSYRAEVTVRGMPDPKTGMIIDLGSFHHALAGAHQLLDHRLLDEVPDLGPATLENLSAWIWRRLSTACTGLVRVTVYRDSQGESCSYFGSEASR